MSVAVIIETIEKRFENFPALRGVSLDIQPGELVALLGPSGSGKTTLLRLIAGLEEADRGRVLFGETDTRDLSLRERRIGFVFQQYALFKTMNVAENISFGLKSRPRRERPSNEDIRKRVGDLLELVQLPGLEKRYPSQLSGGQRQRVALARALAGAPDLLLLDEPLAALDARTRLDVQSELKRHLVGFAGPCLVVTHDPLEALMLADRLLVLEGGRVVQEGAPAHVARRPATEYVARLVGLNLYAGVADGDAVHLDGGGMLVVPDHGERGPVLVALRPSAVVVSPHRPDVSSVRNTWPATVVGLTMLTDRVRLDLAGEPSALVDVTPAAVAELGLAPGDRVWLSAKATELEVYARG